MILLIILSFASMVNIPSTISILLVIPFYNEQEILPVLFKSFFSCKGSLENIGLIGVDHNSTDNSSLTFRNLSTKFGYSEILSETFPIASVGVPRKTGLDKAFYYANLERKKHNKNIIIGSIDADAYVNSMFFEEARRLFTSQESILVFPSRHSQKSLIDLSFSQENNLKEIAIHTIIGIEWLKFQLREVLYYIGAKETRCSSGVFLTSTAYSKIGGHKQYFSADGLPISGESNALGIKAAFQGMEILVSNHLTELDPRRYLKALNEQSDIQGYKKDKSGAKIFTRNDNRGNTFSLNKHHLIEFERKSIKGGLHMLLTRAACYRKLGDLSRFFSFAIWHDFIGSYQNYLENNIEDQEIYNIIGHGVFSEAFSYAASQLGKTKMELLVEKFSSMIPDNKDLLSWSRNEVFHPSLELIH